MSEKIVSFRVDEKIKNDFEKLAKNMDMTTSQLLRKFMKEMTENNKQKGKANGRAN
jgi:antitoxin component of RelBE/YafQ-DinJ toxin-antitoxin module